MTLIKSISGIRGTIGGTIGENLTPVDVVRFTTAFSCFLLENREKEIENAEQKAEPAPMRMVVGRDARISGDIVNRLVCSTLQSMGIEVIDLGLSTTPTTEMAVIQQHADGGIIITASHNPMQWNALKLLNNKGEFVSGEEAKRIVELTESDELSYATVDRLGGYKLYENAIKDHVDAILNLPLVDKNAIAKANFKVILDTVNSTGALALPVLLKALGVNDVTILNGEMNGVFAHNPEPIPENLAGICNAMNRSNFDVGFVVDPDVDRLAFISEDGEMFGEEYTLVSVADYVLSRTTGDTVSNLSSTRALRDVTEKHGGKYCASAVGEVNVTTLMKKVGAVIGGEGNGGVIYPASHYGRDALVGIALFLTQLAQKGMKMSELRKTYPNYFMAKNRIDLQPSTDVDAILEKVKELYKNEQVNDIDGVKIDFADRWVHLRKSNTEPIIRVYSEAHTPEDAEAIGKQLMQVVLDMQ